jgi:hypothetical protein
MAGNVIVRFSETQGYDINIDAEVVRFMATTSSGSYWSDVVLEGPRSLRADRSAFKEYVVELIHAGQPPCQIELDGEEQ